MEKTKVVVQQGTDKMHRLTCSACGKLLKGDIAFTSNGKVSLFVVCGFCKELNPIHLHEIASQIPPDLPLFDVLHFRTRIEKEE